MLAFYQLFFQNFVIGIDMLFFQVFDRMFFFNEIMINSHVIKLQFIHYLTIVHQKQNML